LFWACYLPEKNPPEYAMSSSEIEKMINDLLAYPECQNKMDKNKTAIHAAAISGNDKKLKILLQDLNTRYSCYSMIKLEDMKVFQEEKGKQKKKNKIKNKIPSEIRKTFPTEYLENDFIKIVN
jgi:hypothetical protein